jgi:DNA-binding MarR family transcriptional regulator
MSQILNKLDEMGMIKRTPSKEDGRKVYISLSASGKHLVEQTMQERDEWLKNLIRERLSDKEKEILEKALPILNKLLD